MGGTNWRTLHFATAEDALEELGWLDNGQINYIYRGDVLLGLFVRLQDKGKKKMPKGKKIATTKMSENKNGKSAKTPTKKASAGSKSKKKAGC